MKDKNGMEIKTGMVVRVTGGYYKCDNGLYLVEYSAGDAGWSGDCHSLSKVTKADKISTGARGTRSWPQSPSVINRAERHDINAYNAEHAEIEIASIADMTDIREHFRRRAEEQAEMADWYEKEGGTPEEVEEYMVVSRFYGGIAEAI